MNMLFTFPFTITRLNLQTEQANSLHISKKFLIAFRMKQGEIRG